MRPLQAQGQAGVVDEHVDVTKRFGQGRDHLAHRGEITDVEFHRMHRHLGQVVDQLVEPVPAAAGDDQAPALVGEAKGAGPAEPRGGAGNENVFFHESTP